MARSPVNSPITNESSAAFEDGGLFTIAKQFAVGESPKKATRTSAAFTSNNAGQTKISLLRF